MADSVETKLSAARTRLILDKPFLGALVMRLPMVEANPDWCATTATDARSFYFNRSYIEDLSVSQTQFVLAHEALHCALSHFSRRQYRVKHRWDLACDFAVNPLLLRDDLIPPPNAIVIEEYDDMTAEEIYPLIDDKDDSELLDQHLYDGDNEGEEQNNSQGSQGGSGSEKELDDNEPGGSKGAKAPPPLSVEEQQQLEVQWRQRMASAAQQALQAGKLSGAMARMVDHMLQPQLPWRMLLARYMTATARDDYSYSRPSRREGDAIFPSLRSAEIEVVVVLDTSGSVNDREISEFLSEVNSIKAQTRANITLHACDAALSPKGPWSFQPWEECALPEELEGGGGSDFRPIFEWLDREGRSPNLLVYFTDALGDFPEIEPNLPVIWLVKGKARVPWGQRVQLN
ncbi:hypothetical protein BOW53_05210 [Solemya pervernicosa gill symbiont]|uniref:Metallopeptidase domain-containing protein n=2 Tax=Gammaproteobacteria incertae sedis TaxID=118884 RepID=A0A1T2L7P0_9GAMM|nr:VWA-like domain-containing protein [Solemya pervernicosa gill symbiont]OOZ41128.1 hypothetical protein BOW53_05210 [Solemya pervernicosa gill symbiont]